MKYQSLGKSNIQVSKVSFGAWGLGSGKVWSDRTMDEKQVTSLLDQAIDLGINYIDTAPVYGIGYSEEILGKALKGRREHFIVQTKCSLNWRNEGGEFEYERDGMIVNRDHRASAIRKDVEESLERLQIDSIDSLVVHRISRSVPVAETMEELNKLKEEGKIRALLLSNSSPSDFEEYSQYGQVDGVQEKFSYLSNEKKEYFDTCHKYHALFQVYGSLEEGILANLDNVTKEYPKGDVRDTIKWRKEPYRSKLIQLYQDFQPLCEKYHCSFANIIQAWTLAQYEDLNLLTGFRRQSTMVDTCKGLDLVLEKEEMERMDSLADVLRHL